MVTKLGKVSENHCLGVLYHTGPVETLLLPPSLLSATNSSCAYVFETVWACCHCWKSSRPWMHNVDIIGFCSSIYACIMRCFSWSCRYAKL